MATAAKRNNRADLRRAKRQATIGKSTPSRSRQVAAKKRRKMTVAEKRTLEGRFSLRLREMLDAKKWEVGDFHEQLKRFGVAVEKPAIHAWLRGDTMPKARDLEKIGQSLGLADYRELLPPPG